MKSNLIDIAAIKKRETEKGICLDCETDEDVWFPKQYVEDNGDGTYTMPESLAKEKGVI